MKDILIRNETHTHRIKAIYYVDASVETPKSNGGDYYTRIYNQSEAQYQDLLNKHPQATRMK